MKTSLSDIYEQVLLNEAEKHQLQNPSQDEIGNLKSKQELFGSKPKAVEGPDKAKLKQGPTYAETTGSASKPSTTKTSMPNAAPAKETKAEEGKEMKGTDVDPSKEKTEEEDDETNKKKQHVKEEGFTMSAFETLFKKTITEEVEEENLSTEEPELEEVSEEEIEMEDESGEELEEEENDLISDLRDLQDKLSSILSKLEDVQAEEESLEGEDESYSDEDFEEEFGEEEPVKESVDKPKALNNSKGKGLMSKKNKIGKVNPKGGKANSGKLRNEPAPKALGDKKAGFQKGKPEVKSSVKKGDFIK
jgi:hypothetical protein